MSLLRNALFALSVTAMGSVVYAQDDSKYAVGLRSLLPASFNSLTGNDSTPAADCNACTTGCDSGCNFARAGVYGEYLYMRMRNGDVPYAIPVDGLGPQALPSGQLAQVSPDYEQGFRVGVWFAPMQLLTVRLQFLSWDSSASDRVDVPDGLILQSLTTHPSTDNAALDSLSATGYLRNDLRIFDVDGLVKVVDCGAWTVQGLAGVRVARLGQEFQGNYLILGDTQVDTNSTFRGIGPRFGIESDLRVKGGFGVYGKGSLALLVGEFDTSYSQENVFQAQLVNTGFLQTRVVPNFDLETGFSLTSCNDHLRISLGYMIQTWHNVVSTNDLINAVQTNTFHQNRDNLRDTLIFDSFVARLELRY